MLAIQTFFENLSGIGFAAIYSDVLRYILPLLALLILWRCGRSLLTFRREPEVWAWLAAPSGEKIPVTHWESLVGRSASCDVVLDYPTISRRHAVLTRYDDGSWSVSDIGSKGGIRVNGADTDMCAVGFGDVISLGGVDFTLVPITKEQERIQASVRTRAGKEISPTLSLLLLSVFQVLACLQLMLHCEQIGRIAASFGILLVMEWALFLLLRLMRRSGFDVETVALFLTTLGVCVVASSDPDALKKEMIALGAGIAVFLILGWFLRDLERAKKLRYLAAAAGIALLIFNLLFGVEKYGAKNWIELGPISFQPSELVKLCFIFAGASTLQRLMTRRNLFLYIVYSAAICGCLALINDFGTAIIFFVTFLVTAFMRSGDFATIGLACAGTAFAGVLVLRFKPYALRRFSTWRHVWEYALTSGYSQTRAMMCIASGGLFGLGGGRGWLKYVAAADTDLVFAFVAEEWGLLIALMLVAAIVLLAAFVVRSAPVERSSFYSISAASAVTIMVVQALLNVFGTVDILPLTGVTFPFVSNGGSSMLCVWGLLAFIKAADTRQNASFSVKLPRKGGLRYEKACPAELFCVGAGGNPCHRCVCVYDQLFCKGGRLGHLLRQSACLFRRESQRRLCGRPGRNAPARRDGRQNVFGRRADTRSHHASAWRPLRLHLCAAARQFCR